MKTRPAAAFIAVISCADMMYGYISICECNMTCRLLLKKTCVRKKARVNTQPDTWLISLRVCNRLQRRRVDGSVWRLSCEERRAAAESFVRVGSVSHTPTLFWWPAQKDSHPPRLPLVLLCLFVPFATVCVCVWERCRSKCGLLQWCVQVQS